MPQSLHKNLTEFIGENDNNDSPEGNLINKYGNKSKNPTYKSNDTETTDNKNILTAEKKTQISNILKEDKTLWTNILNFIKVDFKNIKDFLTKKGLIIENKKLREYLDEQGIIYSNGSEWV